ncbi:DUF1189 family protein [Anaerobiospirillum thomasii]|uniref:DUF1189 domain-containing protein n=1 Tax=Anaerobiospirillum thomasii TaxID=179995 RepID=A0A2X0WIU6_9GAMM|nr:DUF1189 family protein [Anaerobiospirillum thomasii]SPT70307.1 Uncharacterised protein [Anaerobiospirillum thomasii]
MQSTTNGNKPRFTKDSLLDPLRALISVRFYFKVLSEKRGFGLGYLYLLCAILALPVAIKVKNTIDYFVNLEVPTLISQMPPSYLDSNLYLSPNDNYPDYKEIRNTKGQLVILYATNDDFDLQSIKEQAEIIILDDGFIVRNPASGVYNKILWSAVLTGGVNFEPYNASEIAKTIASTSFLSTVFMVSLWFFTMLAVNALIVSLLSKLMFSMIFKINMIYSDNLRLSSYASTPVAFLMLLQFYIAIPLSMTIMCCIPLIYLSLLARFIRNMAGSIIKNEMNSSNQAYKDAVSGNSSDGGPKEFDLSKHEQDLRGNNQDGIFKP